LWEDCRSGSGAGQRMGAARWAAWGWDPGRCGQSGLGRADSAQPARGIGLLTAASAEPAPTGIRADLENGKWELGTGNCEMGNRKCGCGTGRSAAVVWMAVCLEGGSEMGTESARACGRKQPEEAGRGRKRPEAAGSRLARAAWEEGKVASVMAEAPSGSQVGVSSRPCVHWSFMSTACSCPCPRPCPCLHPCPCPCLHPC
jgi:hypothetical protein